MFSSIIWAQSVDVQVQRANQPYIVVARGALWGSSGATADCTHQACGVNNTWIFPSLYTQETVCLTIFNSSSSNASFNIQATATNDPSTTGYTANTARWFSPIAVDGTTNSSGAVTINAGAFGMFYFQTSGASRIAILITNSSAINGGADIVISQSSTTTYSSNTGFVISSNIATSQPNATVQFAYNNTTLTDSNVPANTSSFRQVTCSGIVSPAPPFSCVLANGLALFGATNLERARSVAALTTTGAAGTGIMATAGIGFDGTLYQRLQTQSSANATSAAGNAGTTLLGPLIVTNPAGWSSAVQAASASQCSASIAASSTTRHCATGVEVCVSATAAQTQLFANLRDGATGAGTVVWNGIMAGTTGTSGCVVHEFAAGPICGTINTAMTLELSAATTATNGCTTTVKGYDVK